MKVDLSRGHKEYIEILERQNLGNIVKVKTDITSRLISLLDTEAKNLNSNNIVLVTTGSDGRLENIPNSSILEFIVYIDNNISEETKKLLEYIIGFYLGNHNNSWHTSDLEIQNGSERILYSTDNGLFFPTRFLDSFNMGTNYEKYKILWDKFISEIKDPKNNSQFRRFKDRIRYCKKVSETGESRYQGKIGEHFNLDKGQIYYDKSDGFEKGIKNGPLRYYQYKLASLMFSCIKSGNFSREELIGMRKTIKSKFDFLNGKIKGLPNNEQDLKDLVDIYYKFLFIHLEMKKKFNEEGKEQILRLDLNEIKELKEILEFMNYYLSRLSVK